jgi:hypothetical protein
MERMFLAAGAALILAAHQAATLGAPDIDCEHLFIGFCNADTGIVVTRAEMRDWALHPHAFHRDWNYQLRPGPS